MSKNNNFLKGAAILGIAGVIVKILGAIYRIPLTNIIKSEGMGYYQTAYPFYVLLLTISTAGFPVAIAKLVSEKRAIGDYGGAFKVFKVALIGLIFGGILTSLSLAIGSKTIVKVLGNTNAYYALIALVPALFFVPIMSAFRGLFQGRRTMTPTAISQIIEQFFRVVVGLSLTYYLIDRGIPLAAGGASFGGSAGAIMGTFVIFLIYLKSRKSIHAEIANSIITEEYSVASIVKDLLVIAIPITLGSAIIPIMDTIDASIVLNRLQSIKFTESQANDLYGQLKGMAQTLINFPQIISVAISVSLVSAIADANARKEKKEVSDLISSGIRVTLLVGLPSAFGLFVLSKPIIGLLYYTSTIDEIINTGQILAILSFGVIFLTLVQILTAIFQGLGSPTIPVINLAIGAVVKIILTYVLTGIPSINVRGAAISTVVAFAIAAVLDFYSLAVRSRIKFNYKDIFLKPFISSISMAIIVKISYLILNPLIGGRYSTVTAVLIGGISYLVLLIITGTVTSEDMALIPKADKIFKKLDRFKILK